MAGTISTPGDDGAFASGEADESLAELLRHGRGTVAKELGPRRISANVVVPGMIETDFTREALERPGAREFMSANIALGRVGVPDDIGGVVSFLCSEEGRWVNAQRVEASGGMFL